jgi:hypothetical protein
LVFGRFIKVNKQQNESNFNYNFQIPGGGFYTKTMTATLQINNIMREESGDICMSLFVKMCTFCNLTLTLMEEAGHIEISKKQFVASQVNNTLQFN